MSRFSYLAATSLICIKIVSIQLGPFCTKFNSLIFILIVIPIYKENSLNINQECSHNKRGAGPIHLVEYKAKQISFNSFYTSGVKVFKIDKANSEGHVLSKIKTNSCYALICFIFDKTFLLVLYPLRKFSNHISGADSVRSKPDWKME